jgi:hypothetical protein
MEIKEKISKSVVTAGDFKMTQLLVCMPSRKKIQLE